MPTIAEIKVVLNRCFGGFSLSKEARAFMEQNAPELDSTSDYRYVRRDHPVLVRCIEELGTERASGECSKLQVMTMHVELEVTDYDGKESAEVFGTT